MREDGEAGEDVEMEIPVVRADEEEVARPRPVGCPEEHRLFRSRVRYEGILEHVRVVVARVEKRDPFAYRGGSGLLPGEKLPEKGLFVVDEAAPRGEVGHIADDAGLRLRREGKGDAVFAEETPDEHP